jgi:hypothetical protein
MVSGGNDGFGFLNGLLAALARHNAALRVKIDENVVPAVRREPVVDLNGLVAVGD